ncbi:MAG TPA: alpha-E domain-containing protein, partial [Gammaproteobacteria bacterium]
MLSRVAENLYWMARYIERAENTARLVGVNANLLLDLPRGIAPGWEPLIEITGSAGLFRERYAEPSERNVVRFLIADMDNPGAILASLRAARENCRTIRDIVPREVWELLNELYLYARDEVNVGLTKKGRHAYLKQVILSVQTLTGLLVGTMNHDAGYQFMRIGRNLERADMTTRIIDVRSASLLDDAPVELRPFENIQWVSVLKSLTGYQMYRRSMQASVRQGDVRRFLFQHGEFPRSVLHTLGAVGEG